MSIYVQRKNNSINDSEKESLIPNDESSERKTNSAHSLPTLLHLLKEYKEIMYRSLEKVYEKFCKPISTRAKLLYFHSIHESSSFCHNNTIIRRAYKFIIYTVRNLASSPKRVFLIAVGLLFFIVNANNSTFLVHQNGDVQLHPHSFFSTTINRNNNIASFHSYGLFRDIKNEAWRMMQQRVKNTKPHKNSNVDIDIDEPQVWYKYNWDADFTCPSSVRVGGHKSSSSSSMMENGDIGNGIFGDGPKWVCNPKSIIPMVRQRMSGTARGFFRGNKTPSPTNGCLIYSIGVNGQDLEFEYSIQRLLTQEAFLSDHGHGKVEGPFNIEDYTPFCEIHVFDPDGWHKKLTVGEGMGIHYHNWGIRQSNDNSPNFKTFQDTVRELGHIGHAVDIMKVDCKLCEWGIYQDWFDYGGRDLQNGKVAVDRETQRDGLYIIHQLLVEVHGTPRNVVNKFFDKMREENYVIFQKEPNTQTFGGTCQDYAFLELRPEFFY